MESIDSHCPTQRIGQEELLRTNPPALSPAIHDTSPDQIRDSWMGSRMSIPTARDRTIEAVSVAPT
jgi:hypothetical protein